MRMRIAFAAVMMLIAVFAVQNAAAVEAPAPAPEAASDAATFLPAAFVSVIALAFGLLF